jgi:hypothetical protein
MRLGAAASIRGRDDAVLLLRRQRQWGEGITEVDGGPARSGGKLTLCGIANTLGLRASPPRGR